MEKRMPTYPFRNMETGDIIEFTMSYKDLDKFKEDNPQLERYFEAKDLHIMSDAMRMNVPGTKTCDSAFEHGVIERIKQTVPGNTLGKTHKTKGSSWV